MPPASPASTRLQYSASKCRGCLRNAEDRLVPVSTSVRISVSSLVMRGLVLPRATMSKDCSSGTPAFIMVASWRVKIAMSFCLIERPPLVRRLRTLVTRTPWRRRLALTTASPPARISPRTILPFLSLPSHSKMISFGALPSVAVAMGDFGDTDGVVGSVAGQSSTQATRSCTGSLLRAWSHRRAP